MIDYYGRLAKIWEEIQIYKPPLGCTCVAAKAYEKEKEEYRVHQYVMGLYESRFGHVVTAIIEVDELPGLGKVYAKVIREEFRLNSAKNREQQQEAMSFVTRRGPQHNETVNFVSRRDSEKHVLRHDTHVSHTDSASFTRGNRTNNRLYSHCGIWGHDKSACWQIVGYPEWMTDQNRNGSRGIGRGGRVPSS